MPPRSGPLRREDSELRPASDHDAQSELLRRRHGHGLVLARSELRAGVKILSNVWVGICAEFCVVLRDASAVAFPIHDGDSCFGGGVDGEDEVEEARGEEVGFSVVDVGGDVFY